MEDREYNYIPVDNKDSEKTIKKKHGVRYVALFISGILLGGVGTYTTVTAFNSNILQPLPTISDEKTSDDSLDERITLQKNETSDVQNLSLKTTGSTEVLTVADIAEKCLPSVVAITNIGEKEVRSMWGNFTQALESAGSGVVIGENNEELLILTNYHVVEGSNQLTVVFSWEENGEKSEDADIINAEIKDYDAERDIAVISVAMSELSQNTASKITVATVGSSDTLALGEQVVAIGNALGYGQSVTTGIVSALDRTLSPGRGTQTDTTQANTFIQTDAAINPGNSGGALFNMKGELVGINSAKIGSSTVEGMGYAIPISDVIDDVEKMMNEETRAQVEETERGYLGVSIVDVSPEISNTYGIPQGVYLSSINIGSAAEKAGLEKEEVITALNGKKVTSSSELKKYLSYYAKGETVTLTVAHRGEDGYSYRDVEVVLGENEKADTGVIEP